MRQLFKFSVHLHSVREFVWPTYKPERHYMRGPGPACQRSRQPVRH